MQRSSRPGIWERAKAPTWALWLVPIVLLSWPITYLTPGTGFDSSWRAALHLAFRHRLQFGKDIVFTYGPLGFLTAPQLYFAETAFLAFVFVVILHAGLCLTFLHACRRNFPDWLAIPITFLAALVLVWLEPAESLMLFAFVWAAWLLAQRLSPAAEDRVLLAGAAIGGMALLFKLSAGISISILIVLVLLGIDRRPRKFYLKLASTFTGTLIGLWVLTGQSLANLPAYALNSLQVVSGYSRAMGIEEKTRAWERPAALVCILIAVFIASVEVRRLPKRRAWALTLAGLVFGFALFKEGFVRHDTGHSVLFFATVAVVPLIFDFWEKLKVKARPLLALAMGSMLLILAAIFLSVAKDNPRPNPIASGRESVNELSTMLWPPKLKRELRLAGTSVRAQYALDPAILDAARGRTVHIDPWETAIAWAYPEFKWDPAPMFQSATAYTGGLDLLNAEFLDSDKAPDIILRQPPRAIDYRVPAFEAPAANLAMLCHYEEAGRSSAWQVLRRVQRRCGKSQRLKSVTAPAGATVQLPASIGPDRILLARVVAPPESLVHRLGVMAYRAEEQFVEFSGDRVFHLVLDTAQDGLILKVPAPGDFTPPYNFDPGTSSVRIAFGSWIVPGKSTRLRLDFYSVPIAPEAAPTPP